MIKCFKKIIITFFIISLLLTGCASNTSDENSSYKLNETINFEFSDQPLINPYIGFATDAENIGAVGDNSLVYIDITFRELQPESPDKFDFEAIDTKNNVAYWREHGKHAVLKFICDRPSSSSHSDLPDWLMTLTGDGTYYSTSAGQGYSPDYSNENLISYHQSAISALANHYNDGFVSFVEMGSIGHNGNWSITSDEITMLFPLEEVRRQYISHYTHSFTNTKFLIPEPFAGTKNASIGFLNLNVGLTEATEQWQLRLQDGNVFELTGEENALSPKPDVWKKAPVAGYFASSATTDSLFGNGSTETLKQLSDSHISYITDTSSLHLAQSPELVSPYLSTLGYRLGITKIKLQQQENFEHIEIKLYWENKGNAPIYFDLPVGLFVQKDNGQFEKIADININLTDVIPDKRISTKTIIPEKDVIDSGTLYLGIIDPMTGKSSVTLATDQNTVDGYTELYVFKK